MINQSLEHIIEDTFFEFGVEAGGSIPDEKIGAFSSRVAKKITHLMMKKYYEEPLPNIAKDGTSSDGKRRGD